jgi:hypothetical protein
LSLHSSSEDLGDAVLAMMQDARRTVVHGAPHVDKLTELSKLLEDLTVKHGFAFQHFYHDGDEYQVTPDATNGGYQVVLFQPGYSQGSRPSSPRWIASEPTVQELSRVALELGSEMYGPPLWKND